MDTLLKVKIKPKETEITIYKEFFDIEERDNDLILTPRRDFDIEFTNCGSLGIPIGLFMESLGRQIVNLFRR